MAARALAATWRELGVAGCARKLSAAVRKELPVMVTGRRTAASVGAYFDLITDAGRRFYGDSFHLGYFRQGTELLGEALDAHTDLFRDVLGENTPTMIEIRLPPRLEALLAGEPTPPLIAPPVDPNWRIPDSPPAEWRQQLGEEPADDW
jgi:hypothetical protein